MAAAAACDERARRLSLDRGCGCVSARGSPGPGGSILGLVGCLGIAWAGLGSCCNSGCGKPSLWACPNASVASDGDVKKLFRLLNRWSTRRPAAVLSQIMGAVGLGDIAVRPEQWCIQHLAAAPSQRHE